MRSAPRSGGPGLPTVALRCSADVPTGPSPRARPRSAPVDACSTDRSRKGLRMKTTRTVLGALALTALLAFQALPAHGVGGSHCVFRLIPIGRGAAPHAIATRPEL